MPINITPTSRSLQDDTQSTGIKSFSHKASNPTKATPAEWPSPQRIPGTQPRRGRRTASGATAVK